MSLSSRFFKTKISEGPSFITTHSSKGKVYFPVCLYKRVLPFPMASRMDFCCPLFLFPFLFFFILSFSLCRFALLSLGGEFTSQYPAQHCTELQKLNWMSIHNGEKFSRHASLIIVSSFLIIPIEQAIVQFSYHILTAPPLFYTVYLFPLVIF